MSADLFLCFCDNWFGSMCETENSCSAAPTIPMDPDFYKMSGGCAPIIRVSHCSAPLGKLMPGCWFDCQTSKLPAGVNVSVNVLFVY